MAMMISPIMNQDYEMRTHENAHNTNDRPSTLSVVTFGYPLTPIDAVGISTFRIPQWWSLSIKNDDFDNNIDGLLNHPYNPDGNGPLGAKQKNGLHFEEDFSTITGAL